MYSLWEEEEEPTPKGKRPYSSAFASISSSEDDADRQRILFRRRKSSGTLASQKKPTQSQSLQTALFSPPTSPDRFPPNRQASAGPGPSTIHNRHAAAQPSSSTQSLFLENDENSFQREDDSDVAATIIDERDPFLVDEDGNPLTPSEEFTLPEDRNKQYVFFESSLHGQTSQKGSRYIRLSGPRRWTKEEELLLWRTVQRVPATQVYPLRVVWYLHGDGGRLSEKLKWFSVQHMKDKMRTTVTRRLRAGERVEGNARAWAPLGSKEKEDWDDEQWDRMHGRALLAIQLERQEFEKRKEATRLREEERERRKEEKKRNEEEKRREKERKLQDEKRLLQEDKRKREEERKKKREEEKRRREEEKQRKKEEREKKAKTKKGKGRQHSASEDKESEENENEEPQEEQQEEPQEEPQEEQQEEPQEEMDELESSVDGSDVRCPVICLWKNHPLIVFI